MRPWSQVGFVLGGYVTAFILALIGTDILGSGWPPDEANGGMAAFGELLWFAGLLGFLSLLPTALGLWFLRSVAPLWTALSFAALAVACVSPLAMVLIRVGGPSLASLGELLALAGVASSPVFGAGFVLFATIAPTVRTRRLLLVAGTIEGIVALYAVVCLFVFQRWLI